jgi:hypothetical protein
MISNITLGKSGLPEYLVSGRKVGSEYSRDEKDHRLFIDGSIEALSDSIEWVQKNKNWKNSYYHSTLAFTHEEWEQLSKEEGKLQEVVQEYIRLNFPNHKLDEIIYHAEAHVPKILYEPKRGGDAKYSETELIERHPHIHLGISLQNALYSGQVSVGGIAGKASHAKSIEFKQACDEILCSKYDLIPAVAGEGKEPVKRKSLEENLQIWDRFKSAAQGRSKGKELKSSLETTSIDVVDVVYDDLPKANPPKLTRINDDEIALKNKAKARLKNLKKIYNPSEVEKQIDGAVMARLREIDSGKLIPFIAEYFGIPADKIRKSEEGENKIEILQDGKWKKNSNTDFCSKILGLGRDETVKLVGIFSALDSAGVGVEKLRTTIRGKELVKNIANIALDELGYKFQNIPSVKISVSRNLDRLLSQERQDEIRAKNPTKPVYVADIGYKPEYFSSLIELAEALDYTKIAGYSIANFKNGKRNNDNIESLNPTIILDVDNRPEIGHLVPIEYMKEKLETKGISALLLPSASNSEEYNRYRVIVPTAKEFSFKGTYENWKEDYQAYIENFVDFLGIEEDKKKALDSAMFRPAQFYYGSAPDTTATLTNGKVFDNSEMLEKIYQERERINANMQLKLQEKQYAKALENIEEEVDIVFQNLKKDEDKLNVGQDNDIALTRTVISNINRVINVVDAAKLRYPKAYVKDEGRYKILYTSDQEQDGNRNLLGEFGAYNFSREKTRTSYDFMREYLELLNLRIAKFNNDNTLTMDEKEKLKNFLTNSPLVSKLNEQPLEFKRINVYNGNNYAILVKHFFPNQYDKVCLVNYRGIAQNLARYMKNIEDQEGLEQFKQHYRIKSVNLHNGKIGYLNGVSLKELRDIGGLSEEWINPKKPEKEFKKDVSPKMKQSDKSMGDMNF